MQTVAADVTQCPLCRGQLRDCVDSHTNEDEFPGPRRHCTECSTHNFLVEVTA